MFETKTKIKYNQSRQYNQIPTSAISTFIKIYNINQYPNSKHIKLLQSKHKVNYVQILRWFRMRREKYDIYETYKQPINKISRCFRNSKSNLSDFFKHPLKCSVDPLKCSICNTRSFNNFKHLLGHYSTVSHAKKVANSLNSLNYFCSDCQVQSSNKKEFITHIRTFKHVRLTCPNPLPYYCEKCHRQYFSVSTLNQHKGSKTCIDSVANPAGDFACNVCNQIFHTRSGLAYHFNQFPDHKIAPLTEQPAPELSQTSLMVFNFCKFIDKDQVAI